MGVGLLFDVLAPAATAGFRVPAPQLTFDARYGLGARGALLAHLHTLFVTNQIEVGAGYTASVGPLEVQGRLYAGALLGALEGFGFAAASISPLVRPGLVASVPIGAHRVSLAGDLLFVPLQQTFVGGTGITVRSFPPLMGASVTLTVEAMLAGGGILFYGAALMHTQASYQIWLLYSDDPNLLSYPRIFAGYAF
jgi:hypothetical protein